MISMHDYLPRKQWRMKPSEQRFIEAAREDRVFWRGDDLETFKLIYEETQRMRSMGAKGYRAKAMSGLKNLMGG